MAFRDARRFCGVSALALTVALLGCQGDDNALPLPPSDASADTSTDAKATDAASDATTHAGDSAASDASQKDASPTDASSDAFQSDGADGGD
jgi:hypothetical protein